MRLRFIGALVLAAGAAHADPAAAPMGASVPDSPFAQCDAAIAAAARLPDRAPDKLLGMIARVESGRLDPATGRVRPWPWTINVEGVGYFYDSKDQVLAAVRTLQAAGKRSIDVGCMQVNLMHHPRAFPDLETAFDPPANAAYAVRFLVSLYQLTKDWGLATAYYHSSTPDLGEEYQRLVFGRVLTPMGGSGGKIRGPYAAWPSSGERYAAIPPASFTFGAFDRGKPRMVTFAAPGAAWATLPGPFALKRPGQR